MNLFLSAFAILVAVLVMSEEVFYRKGEVCLKVRIKYVCELCESEFDKSSECEKCEATHYGLTLEQYLDWKLLLKEAERAGLVRGYNKNPVTDKAFDNAVRNLVQFEESHELIDCKRPSNWTL